ERGIGDRDAHHPGRAVREDADRVDRLGRSAGGDHDVAPGQVRLAGEWRGRWAARRIGRADGAVTDKPHRRLDDRRQGGQAPDAALTGGERSLLWLEDRVA